MAATVAIVAVPMTVTALAAAPPVSGGTVVGQCQHAQGSVPLGQQACRTAQAGTWGTAAACRTPLESTPSADAPEDCAVVDGRPVSEARVAAYQTSWLHRALSLQRDLTSDAPLLEEQLVHTHNSFNSSAYRLPPPGQSPSYYPTLTNQDPNQVYSLTDQLRMDVRAIEIDVHWVPSPWGATSGGYEVVACHGSSEAVPGTGQHVHVGCTDDRPFADALKELRAWLQANPDQFVLLYLENQLDGSTAGHERAGQLLADNLGSTVYRPPAGQPCADMPLQLSARQILASGAQVLIVGNCDAGNGIDTAWGTWVHSRGAAWDESGDPTGYGDAQCTSDLAKRNASPPPFRRYFEETTWLAAMGDTTGATSALGHTEPITADAAAQMTRCGANIIGIDQLTPEDPRLPAQVWSWAPDQPTAAGGCAYQGGDSRFRAGACGDHRHFACADASGGWHVTAATGRWDQGAKACSKAFPGSTFSVPRNGWRNAALASAKSSSADEVWLAYRVAGS